MGLAPDESGAGPEPQPPIAVEDAESWLGTVFDHALTELKKNDPKQAALDAFNEIKKTIPEVAEAMANWEPDSLGDWVSAFAEVGLGAIFDSLALAWNTGWELGSIITDLRRAYRDQRLNGQAQSD